MTSMKELLIHHLSSQKRMFLVIWSSWKKDSSFYCFRWSTRWNLFFCNKCWQRLAFLGPLWHNNNITNGWILWHDFCKNNKTNGLCDVTNCYNYRYYSINKSILHPGPMVLSTLWEVSSSLAVYGHDIVLSSNNPCTIHLLPAHSSRWIVLCCDQGSVHAIMHSINNPLPESNLKNRWCNLLSCLANPITSTGQWGTIDQFDRLFICF